MTPQKPLIFLVKVRDFLFQLVSRQTTRSRHFGGDSGGYLGINPPINNTKAKRKLFKLSDGGGLLIGSEPWWREDVAVSVPLWRRPQGAHDRQGDRLYQGKECHIPGAHVWRAKPQFRGQHFWARGYFVSTVR